MREIGKMACFMDEVPKLSRMGLCLKASGIMGSRQVRDIAPTLMEPFIRDSGVRANLMAMGRRNCQMEPIMLEIGI